MKYPETFTQRRGQQTAAGRRANKRKWFEVEIDRLGVGPFIHDKVDLETFHGRVQKFFDDLREAVDLVDKKDVAFPEIGEDPDQVSGALNGRAGGNGDAGGPFIGGGIRPGRFSPTPRAP